MWKARIAVPPRVTRDELVEIKTLIAHPMESGFRRDNRGAAVPRDILTTFICRYNGVEVLRAELFPAIAANPFMSFFVRARDSGPLEFEWQDQSGGVLVEQRMLTVD